MSKKALEKYTQPKRAPEKIEDVKKGFEKYKEP